MIPPQFHIQTSPLADPAAMVIAGQARFTILTDRLIRIEYAPSGQFEDHASQAFWFRKQPVPKFELTRTAQKVIIETEALRLEYLTGRAFSGKSLSILVKSTEAATVSAVATASVVATATEVVWHYADNIWNFGPLWGTARTLDGVSGGTRLDPGPMARSGCAVLDDSKSVVFNAEHWVEPRAHPENLDVYFFGYGHDYVACLRDYVKITGPAPMLPRYILGNWWSRYWAYTQAELTALMQDFQDHDVPLSICIVDMDWHLAGWTGYTWNRELWPDPQQFIAWLHAQGLKTALNLHPSDGVGPHEAQYPLMAAMMGVDPATQEPVRFDIANTQFAMAYFDILLHPYEAMGVNFWWMDWQQERVTSIPGLDPLWWLNHLHYLDLGRNGKRPFVFSRWGGLGNHRYPIGFSGDTHVTWESLAFQPPFTSTAANVNYGWWSHDIGGHQSGVEDDELYTRWVQYGVFSPILRMHCTKNPYHERRPWARGAAANQAASQALRLRHQLIPYIYSMAWRNHRHSLPLVTPMYYWNPEDDAAYNAGGQYWFGSELIAAPYTAPADPKVGLSRQRVWLPEGTWFHFFTGERVTGGGWRVVYGDLNDTPVYAKAGAIVPLAPHEGCNPESGWGGIANPDALTLHIFPGASNRFEMYEDDGETNAYQQGKYALTAFTQTWGENILTFNISAVEGEAAFVPAQRQYTLLIRGVVEPAQVVMQINQAHCPAQTAYDPATQTLTVTAALLTPQDGLTLTLTASGCLLSQADHRPAKVRAMLRTMPIESYLKQQIDADLPALLSGERSMQEYAGLSDAQVNALQNVC
jgi:alpha-glucosidase (family GH31 glycosyl hydrolase)